jgi:hypothetical protein
MIQMVQELNPKYFDQERLTCHTCHRGKPYPGLLPEGRVPGW